MGDRPEHAGHDRRGATLARAVEHFDADDVGGRCDAAELHRGVATVLEGQGSRAVAGDETGHECAVPGVVVGRLLVVDEVLPAYDPAVAEVGRGGDAAVDDGDAFPSDDEADVGNVVRHERQQGPQAGRRVGPGGRQRGRRPACRGQ